jgi:hypothetical protein
MIRTRYFLSIVAGRGLLSLAAALTLLAAASCARYRDRDPTAEVVITSNRSDATVYLVPVDKQLATPPTEAALNSYAMGVASPGKSLWVHHGRYWIVLEKNGAWSKPAEFEVRLDYVNKVHVEF